MSFAEAVRSDPILEKKAAFFEHFWEGEGPYPIIFAKPHLAKGRNFLRWNLVEQHADPRALLDEALELALPWTRDLDDGIPVARADLGTTLLPSALGLGIHVEENAHPWLADHLDLAAWVALRDIGTSIESGRGEIGLADLMYGLLEKAWREASPVQPYLPDTQGLFDLAHIIVGSELFYAFYDDPDSLRASMERSLELWLAGTLHFKRRLGEATGSMLHGHGMPSGVWFPDTGARISEDSCTLLSPELIEEFCLPYLERAARPFGSIFLHFCGRHEAFLELMASRPWVSAINLGNPELYDLGGLLSTCGRTGTVYFGHLDPAEGEGDEAYLERLAELAARGEAGLILVAPPGAEISEERCRSMRAHWHRLTANFSFRRTRRE